MRIEDLYIGFSVVKLIFCTNSALDRVELYQSTPFVFHVNDSQYIAEILKDIIKAFIRIVQWDRTNEDYLRRGVFKDELL